MSFYAGIQKDGPAPYVFKVVDALKMELRRQGEDIIDLGMGNPDIPTNKHAVDKLADAAQKGHNHRYSKHSENSEI